jgi:hypothetical protein
MSKVISAIISIVLLFGAERAARFWKHPHAEPAADVAMTASHAAFDQISLTTANPIITP